MADQKRDLEAIVRSLRAALATAEALLGVEADSPADRAKRRAATERQRLHRDTSQASVTRHKKPKRDMSRPVPAAPLKEERARSRAVQAFKALDSRSTQERGSGGEGKKTRKPKRDGAKREGSAPPPTPPGILLPGEVLALEAEAEALARKAEPRASVAPAISAEAFVALYHENAPDLPMIRDLTEAVRTKIRARVREHPDVAWWSSAFRKANASTFARQWIGLHWLIRNPENASRVNGGEFDDSRKALAKGIKLAPPAGKYDGVQ